MPLSDDERRRLEKLEQELAATDPDLNLELQSGKPRGMSARAIYGILAVMAGFGLVIAGIIMQLTIMGVPTHATVTRCPSSSSSTAGSSGS